MESGSPWYRLVLLISAQETRSSLPVALEQLRDCSSERDDRGTLDKNWSRMSARRLDCLRLRAGIRSGLTIAGFKDALQEIHGPVGERALCAARSAFFRARGQSVLSAGRGYGRRRCCQKEENVGLEPLIGQSGEQEQAAQVTQALDYTAALLVPFVGSPVVEEPAEAEPPIRNRCTSNGGGIATLKVYGEGDKGRGKSRHFTFIGDDDI